MENLKILMDAQDPAGPSLIISQEGPLFAEIYLGDMLDSYFVYISKEQAIQVRDYLQRLLADKVFISGKGTRISYEDITYIDDDAYDKLYGERDLEYAATVNKD